MKKFLFALSLGVMALTIVQCSDDGNGGSNGTLYVNGDEYKLGTNGVDESTYNSLMILTGHPVKTFNIVENTNNLNTIRTIFVSVNNEDNPESLSGTYTIDNMNILNSGNASVTIEPFEGATTGDAGATGSVTVESMGNNKYKLTFNDVILDEGTASETTIVGFVEKTFEIFDF